MTLYGIKSCDTCRKARQAAEKAGKTITFVDIRDTPLSAELRTRFLDAFGEALINKKSTTWRGLSEAERAKAPEALLAQHPTLMKRPVLDGAVLTLGWSSEVQDQHLG
ncbi:MAG: arsenate reductase family protein [Paracoccaceae bacterium]